MIFVISECFSRILFEILLDKLRILKHFTFMGTLLSLQRFNHFNQSFAVDLDRTIIIGATDWLLSPTWTV